MPDVQSTATYDRAAAVLSLSCVAHCVLLPVIAVSLPFVAAVSEAEWVHWMLTALSVAASAMVIGIAHDARKRSFLVPALGGIALLIGALFTEKFGFEETLPAVIGGVLLAVAHLSRLSRHH